MQRYGPGSALIVVDVQNDFADPSGSLSVAGAASIIPRINREIESARANGALVVATQDWHPPSTPHFAKDGGIWPVHCVADTWGAALYSDLTLPHDAPCVRKGVNGEDGYSGFTTRDPLTGETAKTELDAIELGYRTDVLVDACAPVDLRKGDGDRAVAGLEAAGVGIVRTVMR